MANRKYFGTDGVRGKVGTYPITPDFALKLGWAAGKVLASQGSRTVLIGNCRINRSNANTCRGVFNPHFPFRSGYCHFGIT